MSSNQKGQINNLFTLLTQHKESGLARAMQPRVTDLYSVGDPYINEYIGGTAKGGYGREAGYEIVLIFAGTGENKSTFATQMIIQPALSGARIAYYSLEDDVDDLYARLWLQTRGMVGKFENNQPLLDKIANNIMVAPESDGYTLEQMAHQIESLFMAGIDIVVVDPLQFIFEASIEESNETENNRQRKFMRQINNVMKRATRETKKAKTIIIVSHTNKSKFDNPIDTIMGSSANKQVPTKIIQLVRTKEGARYMQMFKSRFTEHRFGGHPIELDKDSMLLHTALPTTGEDIDQWVNTELRHKAWMGGKDR